MTIDILQENIDRGQPDSPRYCALALALCRYTRRRDLLVGTDCIYGPKNIPIDLPPDAQNWMKLFDAQETEDDWDGTVPGPFAFDLPDDWESNVA